MKIYTKQGDKGETSLFGGNKVSKDHLRVEAYGTVDELNSFVGLLISKLPAELVSDVIINSQHILFNIGSNLANDSGKFPSPEIKEKDIQALEIEIDNMDDVLPELRAFILPGGSELVSVCHICRTVCRRAERRVVSVSQEVEIVPEIIVYLNRLSDYFFTFARKIAQYTGVKEVKWDPKS